MLLKIDFESEIPIYIQIKNEIIKGIAKGNLVPDEILPPVRQLASDLGINMHTVNKSYNLLKSEGYLVVDRRKGAKILNKKEYPTEEFKLKLSDDLELLISQAVINGVDKDHFLSLTKDIFTDFPD